MGIGVRLALGITGSSAKLITTLKTPTLMTKDRFVDAATLWVAFVHNRCPSNQMAIRRASFLKGELVCWAEEGEWDIIVRVEDSRQGD